MRKRHSWRKILITAVLCPAMALSMAACSQKDPGAGAASGSTVKESIGEESGKKSEEVVFHPPVDTPFVTPGEKEETVYVKADAAGNPTEKSVEVVLKEIEGSDPIEDRSNLRDIKNTEGNEEVAQAGEGRYLWENHGEDIHYKGISDEKLPVDVHVTYFLEGQEVSAEQIAGKTGKVKIRFDYDNNTDVPFMVLSSVILSSDVFSDLEVTNGKVMDLGDQKAVIGFAFPGLMDRLKLADYEPTEEIELISSYLAYEPYGILVVNSEKALLHDLKRLRNVSTLIIGSTFMDSSIRDICWMIREHYTLGQLPILLVQRDPDLRTHVAAQKLANSVTTALSDRFEFCQKVRTLVELQASVQSTFNSRLAFLQAQMNPHFIFNTMNTIMAMCLKDPMQAYDLLGYFSHYLRSSLFSRDLDRAYPVYEEVDLITAYLSIEKARFQEQIDYEIESGVPDDWRILPMLIEPLVENSVKHGKHGNAALHIRVRLAAEGDSLSVLVEDDGAGFDPERQSHIAADSEPHNRSIGLENVKARLKLYYNEPLRVESAPGQGTRVSFVVHSQP